MNSIDGYLQKNIKDKFADIKYYLFDFDHVIALYNKSDTDLEARNMIISILAKRKQEKKLFITCAKELGYTTQDIRNMLIRLSKTMILNPYIKKAFDKIKRTGGRIILATNNSPTVTNYFLLTQGIDSYFYQRFHPENCNWKWKPDIKYYINLQMVLNISFPEMMFIDDNIDHVKSFRRLGGKVIHYKNQKL